MNKIQRLVWKGISNIFNLKDIGNQYRHGSETLRKSEARYRQIMDNMLEGCQIIGFDYRYLYLNNTAIKQSRKQNVDILGRTMMEVYPGIEHTIVFDALVRCMNERTSEHLVNEFKFPDGSAAWFELNIQPVDEGVLIFSFDITERKQIEDLLIETESKFRTIFDFASDGFLGACIEDHKFYTANNKICEMLGYSKEELLKLGMFDIHPNDSLTFVEEQFNKLYRKEISIATEIPVIRKDRTLFYADVSASTVILDGKKYLICLFRDMTEPKKFEREQFRLMNIIEKSLNEIYVFNATTLKFEYLNQGALRNIGYTLEEMKGLTPVDIKPEYTEADFRAVIQPLITGEKDKLIFTTIHRRKDGTDYPVIVHLQYFKQEDNNVFFAIINDVTDRKKAEEAIRHERMMLRTLIDNLPDAIYVKDALGRKLIANTADLRMMNSASEAEIIGKTDPEIFNSQAGMRGYTEDMSVLKTGQPLVDHEECYIDENGNRQWRLTSKIPLYNEQGQIVGLVGLGRNITGQKLSEEQLLIAKDKAEESDRLKTAFLHNISHEIRTPMNAIVGFSGFLNDPGLPVEKRQHFTNILVQSSNQLLSIITDIINIATIEAGQLIKTEKAVNINHVLQMIFEQFSMSARDKDVEFNYKTALPDNEAIIATDNTKLIEILSNLISNALKFTRKGQIGFGYLLKNDYLEFYVEDSGIGIAVEMHQEIFKRFRQIETTANRQFGGSGLGLSISKAYVELLGGKIWVNSELGKGAKFNFTIPYNKIISDIINNAKVVDDPTLEIKKSVTILIAEDEDSNHFLLEELLADIECNIIRAVNGLEAIEICKSNPLIELVLMDIKMPEVDGYEATRQIRKFNAALPIIAQTAHALPEDKDKAFEAGCNDYLSKPINREKFFEMIRKYLA